MTIAQAEVAVSLGWGTPGVGQVVLVEPRLYGTYRKGKLSFGSLDKLLFTESSAPFRLPDMQVEIRDGRARLDSDLGPVGIKLDGGGALRGGFAAELAAIAPELALGDCRAQRASLYGKVTISGERPRFGLRRCRTWNLPRPA